MWYIVGMKRIKRDRLLTPDEAAQYREVRGQVEAELPELIDRHMERTMKLTATLTTFNSKIDRGGQCYWAFRWVDHATGKVVEAKHCGGEGNISAIRRYINPELDDWDRSVQCISQELSIREFDRMVKDWAYAGSNPEDLAVYIRTKLKEEAE